MSQFWPWSGRSHLQCPCIDLLGSPGGDRTQERKTSSCQCHWTFAAHPVPCKCQCWNRRWSIGISSCDRAGIPPDGYAERPLACSAFSSSAVLTKRQFQAERWFRAVHDLLWESGERWSHPAGQRFLYALHHLEKLRTRQPEIAGLMAFISP